MIAIKQQLVQEGIVGYGYGTPTSITVHETGNSGRGAGAQSHANLQSRPDWLEASWNYQVDDKNIIQSYVDTWMTGHALWEGRNSISVEICVNPESNFLQAAKNAAELVGHLMKKHGITTVYRHYDWSRKDCPENIIRGNRGIDWNGFMAIARGGSSVKPPVTKPAPISSITVVAQQVIAGSWGNGQDRIERLKRGGHNPVSVQNEVNRLLGAPASSKPAPKPTVSVTTIAQQVIAGSWGNGQDRIERLKRGGHNPVAVQNEVNRLLS